jgi:putative oxidoreductase
MPAKLASRISGTSSVVTALFRIVVGFLFACHGAASLFGVLGGSFGKGGTVAFGVWPGWWAAVIELVAGGLVLVGLATRPAAVLCSGAMAYAYFFVHLPHGLFPLVNGGEDAALFCWSFLAIAALGPGAWAVDNLFARARTGVQVGDVNRAYGSDARVAGLDRQGRAGVETAQERS